LYFVVYGGSADHEGFGRRVNFYDGMVHAGWKAAELARTYDILLTLYFNQ
jgi:hypothetical protein